MRESKIEKKLKEAVEAEGWLCLKLVLFSGRGFPDRTLIGPGGRLILVELKRHKGVLAGPQKRWRKIFTRLRVPYFKLDRVEDIQKVVEVIENVRSY